MRIFDRVVSVRSPLFVALKPGAGREQQTSTGPAGSGVSPGSWWSGLCWGGRLAPSAWALAEESTTTVETPGQEVIRPLSDLIKPTGGLAILRGTWPLRAVSW